MGGFFGAVSKRDVVMDVFFGVDYHSHLGTRRAGMIVLDHEDGYQRQIHSIENTPFRTKFEDDIVRFHGTSAIGCISDADPQPLLDRASRMGTFALATSRAPSTNADEPRWRRVSTTATMRSSMALGSGAVNAHRARRRRSSARRTTSSPASSTPRAKVDRIAHARSS